MNVTVTLTSDRDISLRFESNGLGHDNIDELSGPWRVRNFGGAAAVGGNYAIPCLLRPVVRLLSSPQFTSVAYGPN
jgi:hypothetical protein